MAAPWSEGLSAELQSSSTKALAVVEHVAATLPGGFVGYVPTSAQPAVLANGNPWALVTEDNGVKVYGRKVDGGPPYAVGVAHFSQPAEAVADFLFQPANMHRWNDELCEKGELLRQLNPDAALGHLIYYGETALGITVVSTRNLIILTVRERREGGVILIGSASVDDSMGPPPPKGTVRARLLSGGGIIKPSADGGCDVMFMTQVDFGGKLPQSIVTMVSKTSPLSLAVAKKLLAAGK